MTAIANLTTSSSTTCCTLAPPASMMGTASSEVARNTATSVAGARKPAENSADAAAENPHWGMEPASAPTTGPNFAARESSSGV